MLTMGQKVIAIGTLLFLDVVLLFFAGLLGLGVGLFATIPLGFAILTKF